MKRYQVYLDPHSVSILDEIQKLIRIPRSQLIRGIIDRYAQNLAKLMVDRKDVTEKEYALDSLIGSIKIENKEETNFAQKPDTAYLRD